MRRRRRDERVADEMPGHGNGDACQDHVPDHLVLAPAAHLGDDCIVVESHLFIKSFFFSLFQFSSIKFKQKLRLGINKLISLFFFEATDGRGERLSHL